MVPEKGWGIKKGLGIEKSLGIEKGWGTRDDDPWRVKRQERNDFR